jgi:hypothetical protein
MSFEPSAALLTRKALTPMMNDVSFIVVPAAAGFVVLAAALTKDQEKAELMLWRREHPQEADLSRGGLMTVTVKRGHLHNLGADEGYIAGAQAFLDDGTGSRHTLTRVVTVARGGAGDAIAVCLC